MKSKTLIAVLVLMLCVVTACKESNDLDSIEISAVKDMTGDQAGSDLFVCDSNGDQYRQFKVTGYYDDDSEEDLTDEVEWTTDATDDTVLSGAVSGMIYCRSDFGVFGIVATYTLETGNADSESSDSDSTTEFTDSALVKAQ